MRGNRTIEALHVLNPGSIPAHAGKPIAWCVDILKPRVYPRPCGETFSRRDLRTMRVPPSVYPRPCGETR